MGLGIKSKDGQMDGQTGRHTHPEKERERERWRASTSQWFGMLLKLTGFTILPPPPSPILHQGWSWGSVDKVLAKYM